MLDTMYHTKSDYFSVTVNEVIAALEKRRNTTFSDYQRSVITATSDYLWEMHNTPFDRARVLCAGTGSGKTTGALVGAVALFKTAGIRSLVLAHYMESVEELYSDLVSLLDSDTVGCWSQAHNANDSQRKKDINFTPSAYHFKDKVAHFPILVITHQAFKPHLDRTFVGQRDLFVFDECPDAIDTYHLSPSDFRVFEEWALATNVPRYIEVSKALSDWSGDILRDKDSWKDSFIPVDSSDDRIRYIASLNPREIRRLYPNQSINVELLENVINFCKGLTDGNAFIRWLYQKDTKGKTVTFHAYKYDFPSANSLILDATAWLDGYGQLEVRHREKALRLNPIRYDNLSIEHVEIPETLKRLTYKTIVRHGWHLEAALDDIDATLGRVPLRENVLLVVPNDLEPHVLQRLMPGRKPGDRREKERGPIPGIGGKLHVIHWGEGIGSNAYRECSTVILWGEFHQRREVTASHTNAALERRATTETLAGVQNRVKGEHLLWQEGHFLKWFAQIVARGVCRLIDGEGVASPMRVITNMKKERLQTWGQMIFPGCTINISKPITTKQGGRNDIIASIFQELQKVHKHEREITLSEIGNRIGSKNLRPYTKGLIGKETRDKLNSQGWEFITGNSRTNPSRFIRCGISGIEV